MDVVRSGIILKPSHNRVVFRPFEQTSPERALKIIARIVALSEEEVERLLSNVLQEFGDRHQKIQDFFQGRFECVKHHLLTDKVHSYHRQLLIGAYFTQEYALESAALFNPSMIWHPDQSGLPPGSKRFILSLRATGEGHISSITFRSGSIDADNRICMDEPTRFLTAPELVPNALYDCGLFKRKLFELGLLNPFAEQVLLALNEHFTLDELQKAVRHRDHRAQQREDDSTARGILHLARSNYEIRFAPELNLSERIIFPTSPAEANGIEDARFVEFHEEGGQTHYYATYTAYDGRVILPQLLETADFLNFKINTLNGAEVRNKGFALFPRKINGAYAMLSRQDGENIFLMQSDMPHFWHSKELIAKPTYPWEFVQLGNCGSPIETESGWLVLTHGVGPMRKYAMGAMLLALNEPTKVVGRLAEPLLVANENERAGYVPNVVYSCGGQVHGRELIIPYAMSDYASTFATVSLDAVLAAMTKS